MLAVASQKRKSYKPALTPVSEPWSNAVAAPITVDEWLAEYERLLNQTPTPDGYTADELAAHWGVSKVIALRRLRQMRDAGYGLAVSRKRTTRLDGKLSFTPCYRLIPPAKRRKL